MIMNCCINLNCQMETVLQFCMIKVVKFGIHEFNFVSILKSHVLLFKENCNSMLLWKQIDKFGSLSADLIFSIDKLYLQCNQNILSIRNTIQTPASIPSIVKIYYLFIVHFSFGSLLKLPFYLTLWLICGYLELQFLLREIWDFLTMAIFWSIWLERSIRDFTQKI